MSRPQSILWFSRLWIGSLIVSALVLILTWKDIIGDLASDENADIAVGIMIFGIVASYAVSLLLWHFIMARRSTRARTILTVLSVLGAISAAVVIIGPYFSAEFEADERWIGWQILENAAVVAGLVANALLFAPGARRWLEQTPDLSDVFA